MGSGNKLQQKDTWRLRERQIEREGETERRGEREREREREREEECALEKEECGGRCGCSIEPAGAALASSS